MDNSVFISYRRNVSAFIARAVFQDLRANGIDVFMDVASIDSGQFDTIILNQIAARPYFLVILTPGTLERCVEPRDWMLGEMEQAFKLERRIIPLVTPNFDFGDIPKHLKGKLAEELPRFNVLKVDHEWFEEGMIRLRTRFLKPIDLPVTPTLKIEEPAVRQKVEQAAAEAPVTAKQLGAQDYFEQGVTLRDKGDYVGAIASYDEAIRLNPNYAEAYARRAGSRGLVGDIDGALMDCNEAIRLDPQFAFAYVNRGNVRKAKGDLDGATVDYNEALHINPQYAVAYVSRGNARQAKGDLDGAIGDFNEAIRLNPQYADAYYNRALACSLKKDFTGAIADGQRFLELQPDDSYAPKMRIYLAQWSQRG